MGKIITIILAIFTLAFSANAFAGQLVFSESFDSIESIRQNGGTFNPSQSSFEQGLVGNALHVRGNEVAEYSLPNVGQLNSGTIDFYFKTFSSRQGLVNLETDKNDTATYNNIMAFINHDLWMEIGVGGFSQYASKYNVSQKKWHHATLVWECGKKSGSFYKLYLDGTAGSLHSGDIANCKDDKFAANFLLQVGKSMWYGPGEAVFDDLRIYDYVLPTKAIKERAKLLENDPERNTAELLFPAEGNTFEAGNIGSLDFSWTGPDASYRMDLSTQPDFPGKKTISLRNIIGSTWAKNFFSESITLKDLKRIWDKTKYEGSTYYWRIAVKQKKTTYSAARNVNIVYNTVKPSFNCVLSFCKPGDMVIKGHSIIIKTGTAVNDVMLEFSADKNFSGKVIKLEDNWPSNGIGYFSLSSSFFNKIKSLAKKGPDSTVYCRISGKGVRNEKTLSDTLTVKIVGDSLVIQ